MFKNAIVVTALLGVCIFAGGKASAQTTGPDFLPSPERSAIEQTLPYDPDSDSQLLRQDLRFKKKQIIAANITLTDVQAQKFWPVYDQYEAELSRITDKKLALVKQYYQNDDSESYFRGRAALEESLLQVKLRYIPIFSTVLSSKETALFFRMDWRLSQMIDLQLEPMPLTGP